MIITRCYNSYEWNHNENAKKELREEKRRRTRRGKKKKDPNDIAEEWGLNGEVLSSRLKSFIGVN